MKTLTLKLAVMTVAALVLAVSLPVAIAAVLVNNRPVISWWNRGFDLLLAGKAF